MSEHSAAAQGLPLFEDQAYGPPHRASTNPSGFSVRRASTSASLHGKPLGRSPTSASITFGRRDSVYKGSPFAATALPKDYLKLLLRAKRLIEDIKIDLLDTLNGDRSELRFIDGLLEAHVLAECTDERLTYLSSLSSRPARDCFAAQTYLRTVLEPAYFNLSLKLREKYRDQADELRKLISEPIDRPDEEESDDGLPEFTPEEAEAALNQKDSPDLRVDPPKSQRASAATFETNSSNSELLRAKSVHSDDTNPTKYTNTPDAQSEKDVSLQRAPSYLAPSPPPPPRPPTPSLDDGSSSDDEDLYSVPNRPVRPPSTKSTPTRTPSTSSTPSRHSGSSNGIPADIYTILPDPPPPPKQDPTWKEIAEGIWPPSEAEEPSQQKDLLLPWQIENHQSDLPLPPSPLPDLEHSRTTYFNNPQQIPPKIKPGFDEMKKTRTAYTPRPYTTPPPLRYAKFSWETTNSDGEVEEVEVETAVNSRTTSIHTADLSLHEPASDIAANGGGSTTAEPDEYILDITGDPPSRQPSVIIPSHRLASSGLEPYTPGDSSADGVVSASLYGVTTIYTETRQEVAPKIREGFDEIYYATAAYNAEEETEISLSASEHVRVLAMGFPNSDGGAWWLVEPLLSQDGSGTRLGWVPEAYLARSVPEEFSGLEVVEDSPGLEVVEGVRPGTPRIQPVDDGYYDYGSGQSYQLNADGTYHYQPYGPYMDEEQGFGYTYDTDGYHYMQGNLLLNRLNRLFFALLPRYFRPGGYRPLFNMELDVLDTNPGEAFGMHELDAMAELRFLPFGYEKPSISPPTIGAVQQQVVQVTFGERMCNPEYHDLGYAYMTQIDSKLRTAISEARVLLPSTQAQTERLISLMVLVANNLKPDTTVADFVATYSYTAAFRPIEGGDGYVASSTPAPPTVGSSPYTRAPSTQYPGSAVPGRITNLKAAPQVTDAVELDSQMARPSSKPPITSLTDTSEQHTANDPRTTLGEESWAPIPPAPHTEHQRERERQKNQEHLLFALEAYLLIPCPAAQPAATTTPISALCSRSHPIDYLASAPPPPDVTIAPTELTALLLHEWRGITFEWTTDPTRHLSHDEKRILLYSNLAFCFLHTLTPPSSTAGAQCSSLHTNGFTNHHKLLFEIASTYRLLFGLDQRSQAYFRDIDVKKRGDGWYDIFSGLPHADTVPRPQYIVARDFPMLGERLLVLKGMLRPTGLRELWRDKRDSLQWYTFWAVVILGGVGLIMGVAQLVVGVLQAWASLEALKSSG